jgi:N-formylglutamate deformylase
MTDSPRSDASEQASDVFTLHRGRTPLLISIPHVGRLIPADQQHRYVDRAFATEDTDWYLDRLYGFAADLGASLLVAHQSRYLIDLNRPPEDTPMYPGRNNTELCPTRFFTSEPLYRTGLEPDAAEIARRVERYWRPYHDALAAELARLRSLHGHAVLFDAHSIKSELPWLFDGRLPHMNLGTVDGTSCDATLRAALTEVFRNQSDYSHVVDARFKGGYITRRYGSPASAVHAVQLEMCWRAYMDETPPAWNDEPAEAVTPLLERLVGTMIDWKPR